VGGPLSRAEISDGQLLFGIVQEACIPSLRERSARELAAMEFDGYAIGGVSVGEPPAEMRRQVEMAAPFLPQDKPRYLMGVGTPPQILDMIARGWTCLIACCDARGAQRDDFHGAGTYAIKNAQYRDDFGPMEGGCECYACRHFTRGRMFATCFARTRSCGLRADDVAQPAPVPEHLAPRAGSDCEAEYLKIFDGVYVSIHGRNRSR